MGLVIDGKVLTVELCMRGQLDNMIYDDIMSQTQVSQSKIAVTLAHNTKKRSLLHFWPFSLHIFF